MNIATDTGSVTITAREIPEHERLQVLPRHFSSYMLTVEGAVYAFMRRLVPDYVGGFWQFFELSNGGFYMSPESGKTVRVTVEGNGYEGSMSAQAAGITACLFAFSHLSFQIRSESLSNHYYWLREFMLEHPEASAILAATD